MMLRIKQSNRKEISERMILWYFLWLNLHQNLARVITWYFPLPKCLTPAKDSQPLSSFLTWLSWCGIKAVAECMSEPTEECWTGLHYHAYVRMVLTEFYQVLGILFRKGSLAQNGISKQSHTFPFRVKRKESSKIPSLFNPRIPGKLRISAYPQKGYVWPCPRILSPAMEPSSC